MEHNSNPENMDQTLEDEHSSVCQEETNNSIALDFTVTIKIPRGFKVGTAPLQWNLSMDRHTLKILSYEETFPGTVNIGVNGTETIKAMVTVHHVKLVGVLNYNAILSGLTPVSGNILGGGVFHTYGQIPVNVDLGYVSDISEIRTQIADLLDLTVVQGNQVVTTKERMIEKFDLEDIKLLSEIFYGEEMIYTQYNTLIIKVGSSPL